MRHRTSGPSSVQEIALRLTSLERAVRAASALPSLAYSTVEGGSLDFNDEEGNLRVSIGEQHDGTAAPVVVNGPTPPAVAGVTADPIPQGIMVRWDGSWSGDLGVAPLDFSRVEIHISSAGADFEPELIGDGSLTMQGSLSSPRGGRFAATGLGYGDQWVKLVPRTLSGKWGPATPAIGPITPGRMTQADFEESVLSAGFVLTGAIQVGDIGQPNPILISGSGGFVAPQPDGGEIRFPVDGSPARITATIVAYTLTVKDGFAMSGQGQISGDLMLADTVRNPTAPPSIFAEWPHFQTALGTPSGDIGHANNVQGLVSHHSDPDILVAATMTQLGSAKVTSLRLISRTTGALAAYPDPTNSKSWVWNFESIGGVARVGTDYFIVGIDHNRSRTLFYRISGTTWDKTGEWDFGSATVFSSRPRMVSSDTQVGFLWVPMAGSLNLAWRRADNFAPVGSTIVLDAAYPGHPQLGDAVYGGDHTGGPRVWVASRMGLPNQSATGRRVYCYNPSSPGSQDAGWRFITGDFTQVVGLHYDTVEGRFLSYDHTGRMWRYSRFRQGVQLVAAYTWYDGDNSPYPPGTFIGDTDVSGINSGTRETAPSPTATLSIAARAWPVIETPPPPDESVTSPTIVDKANRVGIYVAPSGSALTRLDYLPNTAGVATRTVRDFDVLPPTGSPPPATNSFLSAKANPGRIYSAGSRLDGKPRFEVYGSGEGRHDGLIPPGMMMFWHEPAAPPGWIRAAGQSLPIATYADLYASMGQTYGTSNPGVTFNLPPDPGISGLYLVVKT